MESHRFDYVIVGAGTAGCVLANRLSADPDVTVVLIESGGRDWNPLLSIPLGVGMLWSRRLYDWGYDSEPQPELGGRRLEMMRGKVLGGSSSINAMSHVRGRPGDFDRWAARGCPGWSFEEVAGYFARSERWEGGRTSASAGARRGHDGPLGVMASTSDDPLFDAWLSAAAALGYPVLDDYNLGAVEGFGRSQFSIDRGRRASASRAFLEPARHRPNLTIWTQATVDSLILKGDRALGVVCNRKGRARNVIAERAVVLCAGAFGTPALLMRSGIGDPAEMRPYDIPVVADRPAVGKNLQDHPGVVVGYGRREPGAFRRSMRADRVALNMLRALVLGTGPATILPSGLHGFARLRPESAVPDIQFMFRGAPRDASPWFPAVRPAYRDSYAIRPVLLNPRSRGHVRLGGSEPDVAPRIDPRLLSDPADLADLREGVRLARDLGRHASLSAFRSDEITPGRSVRSDAQIDAFIRRKAATAHHPAGTCRMGADDSAVVDTRLRVNGIAGLRIADASVMPDLVSGNINATVMMIAERCADFLLKPELDRMPNLQR
ncbi:MAG TPA: FAD-binding protein [Aurantimonas coralicida]|uniref:FAD-binding protein n=2 Tax=root TaxID=1 RepID=A0A9C9NHR7_9HYPH|nr:FAD-binding protein [Aurantimonas coralicida]HEU01585.1 FAD-binding protein [Aurantimonas coralicida]